MAASRPPFHYSGVNFLIQWVAEDWVQQWWKQMIIVFCCIISNQVLKILKKCCASFGGRCYTYVLVHTQYIDYGYTTAPTNRLIGPNPRNGNTRTASELGLLIYTWQISYAMAESRCSRHCKRNLFSEHARLRRTST